MSYSESVNKILGLIASDPEIKAQLNNWKKNKGTIGIENAQEFSKTLGTATAKHLEPYAEGLEPEEIKEIYKHVSDVVITYAEDAMYNVTNKSGIKYVPDVKQEVEADIEDMLDNLATRLQDKDAWEDVKFLVEENAARSIARKASTSHLKYGARKQQRAGLKIQITRDEGGGCCAYCASLAGTYHSIEDLPSDFWLVHRNCSCVFHYNVGRTKETIRFETDERGNIRKITESQ